jgi:N,N'-diacetylchitobiose non-reducing end deacetylase
MQSSEPTYWYNEIQARRRSIKLRRLLQIFDTPRRFHMNLDQILPKPELRSARVILAVQPHYDDNDIGAGGTLAALVETGANLYYLTVTDDLVGVIDENLPVEAASTQLIAEQVESGAVIGVKGHYRLGFPDAAPIDHFELRKAIIQHIRLLSPDFIFTVDPWTPYEAHTDHVRSGRATAEAAILYSLKRLTTTPEVDSAYQPHELTGIVFYNTWVPNTYFDISPTRDKKHKAIDAYKAQFSPDDFSMLHMWLEIRERMQAEKCESPGCTHAEGFKVVDPRLLHGVGETWKY